ncbi:MAG: hypothetical protein JWQ35_2165 [Bacteriovoracaceae bacterium]|nr:hypothetical protein [Bacteriovoracaceae bacterium]
MGSAKHLINCAFLFLVIFFSFITDVRSESYGLKELFQKAEKNAALQKDFNALHRLAAARLGEVQALRWLPVLDLKVITGVVPDATIANIDSPVSYNSSPNIKSNDFENGFSLSGLGGFVRVEMNAVQPIYTFGKISNAIQAAEGGKQLAEAEEKRKIGELRLLIKRAYYTLQLSFDSTEILKDVEKKLADANDKVEELLIKNAENVSEIDRLKIRVFSADVKSRSLDADRAGRLARSAIAELANISGDWELDQKSLAAEKPNGLKKEDIINYSLKSKPEIVQLNRLVEMKQAEARAVKANLFPTIFLGGQLEYAKSPGRTDINNPYLNDPFNLFNVGAVLGLQQDLSMLKTIKKADSARAEADRVEAQRDQLVIKTKLDAEKSFEEAFSALQGMQINEEGFRAARSWLTSTGLSFNLGTSETKDVLESFAAYFKARVDLIKSVYNLNLSLAELSQVSGIEVLDRLK